MADHIEAQGSEMKQPSVEKASRARSTPPQLVRIWNVARCWIRFSLAASQGGVPALTDFVYGNHYFNAVQVPSELAAFGEILAAHCPERALEVGTARGGTLFFITRLASPQATIISVDLPGAWSGGGYGRARRWVYKLFARRRQRLQLLQGNSQSREMLDRVVAALSGQGLDFLFLDADHSYEGVKKDFELYAPLVQKGGIIALHDIAEHPPTSACEVSRFWNEIKSRYRHIEIIKDRRQAWAGIGVLYIDR